VTGLTHKRVTEQAEQHIFQAQLLIQDSSASSLLALAADTAKVPAFLWKLHPQHKRVKVKAELSSCIFFPVSGKSSACSQKTAKLLDTHVK